MGPGLNVFLGIELTLRNGGRGLREKAGCATRISVLPWGSSDKMERKEARKEERKGEGAGKEREEGYRKGF